MVGICRGLNLLPSKDFSFHQRVSTVSEQHSTLGCLCQERLLSQDHGLDVSDYTSFLTSVSAKKYNFFTNEPRFTPAAETESISGQFSVLTLCELGLCKSPKLEFQWISSIGIEIELSPPSQGVGLEWIITQVKGRICHIKQRFCLICNLLFLVN